MKCGTFITWYQSVDESTVDVINAGTEVKYVTGATRIKRKKSVLEVMKSNNVDSQSNRLC